MDRFNWTKINSRLYFTTKPIGIRTILSTPPSIFFLIVVKPVSVNKQMFHEQIIILKLLKLVQLSIVN